MEEEKFIYKYLSGEVDLEDIDDFIDDWHDGDSEEELCEFLGLSKDEYYFYLATGSIL